MRVRAALQTLGGALLAGAFVTAVAAPVSGLPAPRIAVISLNAAGAWGSYQEMPAWRNQLFDASAGVNLSFAPHGSLLGREALLDGTADVALSAVPFTAQELAHAGSQTFIDAPLQVSAMSFIAVPPENGLTQLDQICDPNDPPPEFIDNPDGCLIRTPYTGPIRLPPDNLAAVLFGYPGGGSPPLRSWSNPAVLRAWGFAPCFETPLPPSGCALTQLPGAGPGVVGRSDGDEMAYFLQKYAAVGAPTVWAALQSGFPVKPDPVTERLPLLSGNTRDGVDQQQLQLLQGGADPVTGSLDNRTTAGAVGYLPPSAMYALTKLGQAGGLSFVQVKNANGDWVGPTPAAISAAVSAGGTSPLYALTHKVKDAYPLTWVEHLYAPAHGLSIQKTEAVAAVIRYIATAGQDVAAGVGEGRLPPALVQQSLDAADSLVRSNCVGAGLVVYSTSDPGPFAPDLPALHAIGPMLHCGVSAPTTTTTTTTTTTPTTFATTPTTVPFIPSGGGSFTSNPPASSSSQTPGGGSPTPSSSKGSTTTTTDASKKGIPAALTVNSLPLPGPLSSRTDSIATFLLGAGIYLVARKPAKRLARLAIR